MKTQIKTVKNDLMILNLIDKIDLEQFVLKRQTIQPTPVKWDMLDDNDDYIL